MTNKPATPIEHPSAPENAILVLFGATGDLAKRKLIPGLYHLYLAGLMPGDFRIIGTAPPEFNLDTKGFIALVHSSLTDFGRKEVTDADFADFAAKLTFAASATEDLSSLAAAIAAARASVAADANLIFYLAVPPPVFVPVIDSLGKAGIAAGARLIIEKPFGSDLESAKRLNGAIHHWFDESDVYRIDHFLGKEAVQNILALRFANGIFEPAWDHKHLAYVQIDVPETLTVEGRGAFYEETGAFRDMVVTHLLQVLGFLAMDPPERFDAQSLNEARGLVFDAIRPLSKGDVVFGQYRGYLQEPGVAANSKIETFVAARVWIDNERWAGVPFFLRTGKAMASGNPVATLGFGEPDLSRFGPEASPTETFQANELSLLLGDPAAIELRFLTKEPGATISLAGASLKFSYAQSFNLKYELEAYERLIHDVMIGDRTLFNAAAGIERLWEVSAPLLDDPPEPQPYDRGSFGPRQADDLISPHMWHLREAARSS